MSAMELNDGHHLPLCSVVVPCRNEIRFIEQCLRSLLDNDYPAERLEIIVVDGGSTDGTREVLARYAARHVHLLVLDNARGIIPISMNMGIRRARGAVILKADAHTVYAPDYISRCVRGLLESGADNVGGVIETCAPDDRVVGRAIARVLAHPLGSGNSLFRVGSRIRVESDTVAFGCYRRDILARVGGYNEALVRSSDMDLNARIRRAGGRILLIPDIVSRYYPRSSFWSFVGGNLIDGFWATYPLRFGGDVLRPRHAAPVAAMLLVSLLVLLSSSLPAAGSGAVSLLGLYAAAMLAGSVQVGLRERSALVALVAPAVFVGRHTAYALGSLWGLLRVLSSREFWGTPRAAVVHVPRTAITVSSVDAEPWWARFRESHCLSIIIPAYNEERRLPAGIEAVDDYLRRRGVAYEIIVVDDGSTDRTADVVASLAAERDHLRIVRLPYNQGKGAAVKAGMLAASGECLVFTDADQSTSIDHLRAVLKPILDGFDVAIGSRQLRDSVFLARQRWHRRMLGCAFRLFIKTVLVRGFRDSQCGFKAFSREAASEIFARVTSPTEIFDTEVLLLATRLGFRVAEVPVKWRDDPDSRLAYSMPRALAVFREVLRVRRCWGVVITERANVIHVAAERQAPIPVPLAGSHTSRLAKRALDIAGSSLGLLVLSPLLLLVGAAIWLQSGRPVLYRGRRIGLRGRPFVMFKFRTMYSDAHLRGGTSTPIDDVRITPVGHFLRRYKLDELPQLLNVLKGDMSLVGPRPQVEWAVSLYTRQEQALLSVRPGMTDYASIRFANEPEILRASADPDRDYLEKIAPAKILLGLQYVRTQSVMADIMIILATLWAIVGGEPETVLRRPPGGRPDPPLHISKLPSP